VLYLLAQAAALGVTSSSALTAEEKLDYFSISFGLALLGGGFLLSFGLAH